MGKLYLSAPANFLLLPSQVLASYHSTLVGFDGGKSCIPTNYEYDLIFSLFFLCWLAFGIIMGSQARQ